MARTDFRSQAAKRLAAERTEYTPALLDLLQREEPATVADVRRLPVDRVHSNPEQPRQHFDEEALADLAASIREHGVLQPVLVRRRPDADYEIIAGERRWRAAQLAGLTEIPAIVEEIGDEAAMEIAIIENLQREDISPLEEAEMFERMTTEHGYSLRKLATKLGKDKGYVENRLRIARAPDEIRELVAERSDTLSAAYELMKVDDVRKRRRLARQVARGELSLVKLRQRIEGKPHPAPAASAGVAGGVEAPAEAAVSGAVEAGAGGAVEAAEPADEMPLETAEGHIAVEAGAPIETEVDLGAAEPSLARPSMAAAETTEPSVEGAEPPIGVPEPSVGTGTIPVGTGTIPVGTGTIPVGTGTIPVDPRYIAVPVEPEGLAVDQVDIDGASDHLETALEELTAALLSDPALAEASHLERQRFAKYLTLAKIKLENAIAVVRASEGAEPPLSVEARLTARANEPAGLTREDDLRG